MLLSVFLRDDSDSVLCKIISASADDRNSWPVSLTERSQPLKMTVINEQEPDVAGEVADVTTVFLLASRCPIGCSMCDLHQNMLPHPTPPGVITRQVAQAVTQTQDRWANHLTPTKRWIKLYNSGNFFDPASIPPDEYAAIARCCEPFSRIIIENHPRFGKRHLAKFRDLVSGQLEVAVGLETVQPRWLGRLHKQMTRDQFDQYARQLKEQQVDLRVFLIVGVPGIDVAESLRWAHLSIRHALRQSARHISLIPARAGHGWNGRANELPNITLQNLQDLQQSAIDQSNAAATITIDTWSQT